MSRCLARILLILVAFGCELSHAANWDAGGGANRSWGNSLNWAGDTIPLPGDDVVFADLGASTVPGTTTSVLDIARTIGGLSFQNSSTNFHTLDLGGFALQENGNLNVNSNVLNTTLTTIQNGTLNLGAPGSLVDLSVGLHTLNSNFSLTAALDLSHVTVNANLRNMIVGEKILGGSGTATGTLTLGNQGSLTIGSIANPGQILVASSAGGGTVTGSADLSRTPSLIANVSQILVGVGNGAYATGNLKLAVSNNITADLIHIGASSTELISAPSSMTLGMNNTIVTPDFSIGGRYNGSSVTIPFGGTLTLGSVATPTNLMIGRSDMNTNFALASSLDLSGAAFNANLSSLTVGERFGASGSGTTTATLNGGNTGAITIGSVATPGNIVVAHGVGGGGAANGLVDFSRASTLTANVSQILVGVGEGAYATGTLKLAVSNNITADLIRVGAQSTELISASSTLALGMNNTIVTPDFSIGGRYNGSSVTIPVGGALALGSVATPTNLTVGRTDLNTNFALASSLNLSGAAFNANLSSLIVGERLGGGGSGSTTATLTGGNTGAITIGSVAAPGNIVIGHTSVSGTGASAVGIVDFSGQTSLTANVTNMKVGTSEGGAANGTMKLAVSNNITANSIVVGSNALAIQTQVSTLALGQSNTIITPALTIGGRYSNGALTIPVAGSLTLGSAAVPTTLAVAQTDLNSDISLNSTMNLNGAAFNATLGSLTVSERLGTGGNGTSTGTLTGGTSGNITIGSPAAPGNLTVGHIAVSGVGGQANGTVDFSGETSLTADLQNLYIGAAEGGTASGTLSLAKTNNITAGSVRVGYSTVNGATASSTLTLGPNTTLAANELVVAGKLSLGQVNAPNGASIQLGTAAHPTNIIVAQQNVSTTFSSNGNINLGGTNLNGIWGTFIVGDRSGGGAGVATGSFTGGNSGSVSIGSAATPTSFVVGRAADAGGSNGTANFGSLDNLSINVHDFSIGTANGGTSRGSVTLAKNADIHADSIVIGASSVSDLSGQPSSLTLGVQNTIQTAILTVGGQRSSAALFGGPSNSVLNLGASGARTDLFIANNNAQSNLLSTGTVDLTNTTLNAFLGNVLIGQKTGGGSGGATGTLTLGNNNNQVDATQIVLGQGTGDGTINFGGGVLTAQSIEQGSGAGHFNWSAGTLHTQTFGTPVTAFNLMNNGYGVLSPGQDASAGLTTIFGAYTQGSSAGMQINLGGGNPGTGYDQVVITSAATLAGTISFDAIGGFEPTLNEIFTVMTFGSRVGDFDSYAGLDLGNTTLQASYVGNSLVLKARPTLDGDVNLDGVVDIQDITSIANNWLSAGPAGDANGDGVVDIQDITLSANHWLQGGGGASLNAVPEPSTIVLGAIGCSGLLAMMRRRSQVQVRAIPQR